MKASATISSNIILSRINMQYLEYDSSMAKIYVYPLESTGFEGPQKLMWYFWFNYPDSEGE